MRGWCHWKANFWGFNVATWMTRKADGRPEKSGGPKWFSMNSGGPKTARLHRNGHYSFHRRNFYARFSVLERYLPGLHPRGGMTTVTILTWAADHGK